MRPAAPRPTRSAAPGPHIASVRRAALAATAKRQPKCVNRKALDSAVLIPNTSAACRPSSINASQSCWRSESRTRRARWWVGSALFIELLFGSVRGASPVTTGIPSDEQGSRHRPIHAPRSPAHATALARAGDARPPRAEAACSSSTWQSRKRRRLQTGFLAASARIGVVFVLCLHVASSMVREFNDKGVDLLLSLDLPRAGYFFGKLLGLRRVA